MYQIDEKFKNMHNQWIMQIIFSHINKEILIKCMHKKNCPILCKLNKSLIDDCIVALFDLKKHRSLEFMAQNLCS